MNAAILSSFPIGEEALAAQRMQTFWENSSNTKLFKDWTLGLVEGMFMKEGLYNNTMLRDFLATELVDIVPNQRFVDIPLVNVESGVYDDFYSADLTSGGEFLDVIFGNFAYPGFFAPENAMGTDWYDGALVWDVDMFSIVNECLATHAMEDIVVDVVLTESKYLPPVDATDFVTYQYLLRAGRIIRYETIMDGLLRAQFAYPNITFRNIVAPSSDLPQTKMPLVRSLNFNRCLDVHPGRRRRLCHDGL